ncbi:M23 family metallopeptidase [Ureibacillus sp. Re31]|uniref:M23 family metallopeptidase n=1 Tax=Ureibacillus galli TaxID=2762222 RepID=A0ABR8X7P6_9BACL|nr:M23 family metallopeptidase [Ureibacillus galli]MBD8025337.1 M23 family metallopeptidase [Ureibacillus galli]
MGIFKVITPEEFGAYFLSGEYETIYRQTTEEFQNFISLEQFIELARSFNANVTSYHIKFRTNMLYSIHYVWLDDREEKAISVSFDEKGIIQRLLLKPYMTYPETDKRLTKNIYTMPIKGEWFVFWGGCNEFINYHYLYESQRYAYDLVQVQNNKTYKDNPSKNENYYAFKQEILAPADGKVVKIIKDIEDNVPGEMNPNIPEGNCVIIEHKHKEYSMLAHLKQHSIQVHEGETVTAGQLIGLCGNSGNSSEPHVHFQVMDAVDFTKGNSIRIRFNDGKEPIQGDSVSSIF